MSNSLIYVVDDDLASRESLKLGLQLEGFDVEAFETAEALLAAFDLRRPNAVVADIKLPGMQGDQLVSLLSTRPIPTPCVVVSGHADSEITTACLKSGAIGVLGKPFDFEELIELVRCATLPKGKAS